MRHARRALLCGLLAVAAGISCSEREIEPEPPEIDIERLCHEHCLLTMECVWTPELRVDFSTQEECEQSCHGMRLWRTSCDWAIAQEYECRISHPCPEFAMIGVGLDGPCSEEISTMLSCAQELDE